MYKGIRMEVTQEVVKDVLHYDPLTGLFTWKEDRPLKYFESEWRQKIWKTKHGGKIAGYSAKDKRNYYLNIKIFSVRYYAHRLAWLAWLYMTGAWPVDGIDHLDGDGLNNKWENLREVDNKKNCWNQRKRGNNKSGVTGVYYDNTHGVWIASASNKYLGRFTDKEDAVNCRIMWEKEQTFISDRHGRVN